MFVLLKPVKKNKFSKRELLPRIGRLSRVNTEIGPFNCFRVKTLSDSIKLLPLSKSALTLSYLKLIKSVGTLSNGAWMCISINYFANNRLVHIIKVDAFILLKSWHSIVSRLLHLFPKPKTDCTLPLTTCTF
jgi:hypothetical protein